MMLCMANEIDGIKRSNYQYIFSAYSSSMCGKNYSEGYDEKKLEAGYGGTLLKFWHPTVILPQLCQI